jgi:hypothetical protein
LKFGERLFGGWSCSLRHRPIVTRALQFEAVFTDSL